MTPPKPPIDLMQPIPWDYGRDIWPWAEEQIAQLELAYGPVGDDQ
jgi:hypothetical protein